MSVLSKETITIIGAGLAGSLLAIYLARRGYPVDVYERRSDPRRDGGDGGRSINLAISARGLYALEQCGLKQTVLDDAMPMPGRIIHEMDGSEVFQPYGVSQQHAINSISRSGLNRLLLDAADSYPTTTFHFQHNLRAVDFSGHQLQFFDEARQQLLDWQPCERVIAADGTASALRHAMVEQGLAQFAIDELAHGYKELTIDPIQGQQLSVDGLHIWPREDFMLIALPNPDRSFTCTLFMPLEGEVSFAALDNPETVTHLFTNYFPAATALMPNLVDEYFNNPTGSLVTVAGEPWHVDDRFLLLGDACHGMVPFFGQGMNCAFEDCTVLNQMLDDGNDNWDGLFVRFQQQRKPDTDAICAMSQQNYHEMRDATAKGAFLLRKQVERELMKRYPDQYIDKYNLVSFHRVPYRYAQACGERQEKLLHNLCHNIRSLDELDWDEIDKLMQQYFVGL